MIPSSALLVFVGAGTGAVARFWIQQFTSKSFPGFPHGVLLINVVGSLLLGLWAGYEARNGENPSLRALLAIGLLGGFTTFSTFSLDAIKLFQAGAMRDGLLYVAISVAGSLLGCWLGLSAFPKP